MVGDEDGAAAGGEGRLLLVFGVDTIAPGPIF